jgi:hypothetical protein
MTSALKSMFAPSGDRCPGTNTVIRKRTLSKHPERPIVTGFHADRAPA